MEPSSIRDVIGTALMTPMQTPDRISRTITALEGSADGMLVTNVLNIRYLTGFTGGAGILAIADGRATLVTDGRYGDLAASDLAASGVDVTLEVTRDDTQRVISSALEGCRRIALEADSVSWSDLLQYRNTWFPNTELIPTQALIDTLRQVKDGGEIARLRAAVAVADAALAATLPTLATGATELEVQWELEHHSRQFGSQQPAFPIIVAAGPNAALPHHRPSARKIVPGDLVLIDFGATIDGYRSDISRTYVIGEASADQQSMIDLVLAAQSAGVVAVGPGVSAATVDSACREIIAAAGRADQFIHSTGHGVGLFIHEDPFLSHGSSHILQPGMVVSVEPGVYVSGIGDVRIEDLVLVTDDGYEVLTQFPKSPWVIPV